MTQVQKEYAVAGITLSKKHPTKLTFEALYSWVIWQLPKHKNNGLIGAVRPPIPEHGLFPAIIFVDEKKVVVYAHQEELFKTPEIAAEQLNSLEKFTK